MARKKDLNYYIGKRYDAMMGRCYRETDRSYKNSGGRGIKVCSVWIQDISSFRAWFLDHLINSDIDMVDFVQNGNKYQLDRINVNGHYTPENCRLVNPQQNARNKQLSRRKTIESAEGTIFEI